MKFLYFTDPHVKGRSPSGRLDDYPTAIRRKLAEIGAIAFEHDVEAIFCGGDLFDTPRVSFNLLGDIAQIITQWDKPVYVVPGNHDLFGYNINSLPHTALGLLARMGVVKLLTRDSGAIWFEKDGKQVSVEGQEYYLGIDKQNKEKDYSVTSTADYRVLLPHAMLLPKPFHPDVPCTLVSEVAELPDETRPNLILCSHYHPEFNHQEKDVIAINPGALGRLEVTDSNKRTPQCLLFDWTDTTTSPTVTGIHLKTAHPSMEVLNFDKKSADKQEITILNDFQKAISNITTEETEAMNIAQNMAAEQDLTEIFDKLIGEMENEEVVSENYVSTPNRVNIESITLHNFQSHKKTTVDLSDKSNAFVGASDSGKTSILRGIKWVLFNEPSGTDFIRHGANKTSVTLKTDTGYEVTRYRTPSSAGGYIIKDPAGEETQFEGIGRDVPQEVTNILQVPILKVGKSEITFQIADQLEGPFFLGMSGGDRAQWLGMLTGVNKLDDGLRNINKELVSARNKKKSAHETYIDKQLELKKKNEELEQQIKIEGAVIDGIARIEGMQKRLDWLENLTNQLDEIETTIKTCGDELNEMSSKVDDVKALQQSLHNHRNKYMAIKKPLWELEKLEKDQHKFKKLPVLQNVLPELRTKASGLITTNERMTKVLNAGRHLNTIASKLELVQQNQAINRRELREAHNKRHEIIGEECPVCHTPIKKM